LAAFTPVATTAAVSKAVCSTGTLRACTGHGPSTIDQQQAGMTATVSSPSALSARRIDSAPPQA
jgi:hypothetical protein